uniref:Pre T-cell antigen receptor alpha n=1 Tax=Marmota marmota marmota TaxID=9994 RepID=A0A8C6ADV7_MARMA
MAGPWLLLLLAFECPALPTGVSGTPFPSLAPPITLLVDGKQQTLVICLVLDVTPPGLDSPIWFSGSNGSALDAFTYGPSPAADGTWTSLAQLSLPSEELAAWEPLVCHTGPGPGGQSQSTQPLQLSGSSPPPLCAGAGTLGQALWLEALRLLLFKLLLFDVLLTCSCLLMQPPAATTCTCGGTSDCKHTQPAQPMLNCHMGREHRNSGLQEGTFSRSWTWHSP